MNMSVKRTPIIVKRTPIIVERTPIIMNRLPWDEVYSKFIKLIHFAARNVYSTFQTESIEDLTQEGQLVLYNCWLLYGDRGWDNFTPMFKASMWRKLREISGKKRHPTTPLESLIEVGNEPKYEQDLDAMVDNSNKLEKVADMVADKPIAKRIFNEFITPSEHTIWESKMDWARKKTLLSFGHNVSVPKSISVSKKVIKRSLKKAGISGVDFDMGMSQLRDLIAEAYGIQKY